MTMAEVAKKGSIKGTTKTSSKNKEKKEKILPLTKVIIRRLPPSMRKETFIEQISPIPDYDYFYFVDADRTLGLHAFCRAYINFINADDIFMFKEKFDNYTFVDNRGNEFVAVVEYAPYQGVPKRKSPKADPKCGTIEADPQYKIFLENFKLEEIEASKQEIKSGLSCQLSDDKKVTTTPLLEYVAARRLEKLKAKAERKEERRKKDLERKKQKEEERKKKKAEENKTKTVIIEDFSDDTSSLKSCSTPTFEFPIPDPVIPEETRRRIPTLRKCLLRLPDPQNPEPQIKTIDFHSSTFPTKNISRTNPPCQTQFDLWYNEHYLQKKFKHRTFKKKDTKKPPDAETYFKRYTERDFPALPGQSTSDMKRDDFSSIYNVWSNNMNFKEPVPKFVGGTSNFPSREEHNNQNFVQSLLDNNIDNRSWRQPNNGTYFKTDAWAVDMRANATPMYPYENKPKPFVGYNKTNWDHLWQLVHGKPDGVEWDEEEARRPKTGKLYDFTAGGVSGDRGTTSRIIYNKLSNAANFKGKNFKEKRSEDSYKKPYDDRKVDSKYKYRDEKFRSFEPEGRYKKQEYKNNFGRDRKRDDERKYSGRSDSRDSRRFEYRRTPVEKPAPEPVLREVKKYSETRRERDSNRQDGRRLAEQYKSSLLNAAAVAAANAAKILNDENNLRNNVDERVSAELPSELVKHSVEYKMDEVDKLAESLEQKVNIVDQVLTDNVEINNTQIQFHHTERIEKPETENSVFKHFPGSILYESSTDAASDNITDITEYVSDTENKKHDRKFYFDRKDPRAERRIRNKDRPSMAIYRPGKARLIQIKETPLTNATAINDSFDNKSKFDD